MKQIIFISLLLILGNCFVFDGTYYFGDNNDLNQESPECSLWNFVIDENQVSLGLSKCNNNCQCDGRRVCVDGCCKGDPRDASDFGLDSSYDSCLNPGYPGNGNTSQNCSSQCDCPGNRFCSTSGFCHGTGQYDENCTPKSVTHCHSSCNCDQGSNVCTSCKFANIGAQIDIHQRSCPCPAGWYSEVTSTTQNSQTTFTFECKRLINTDGQGNDISEYMDACKLEIGLKTKDMKVLTDCHFENIDGKSFVISDVKFDYSNLNFNPICLDSIRSKIQFKQPSNNQYVDLPSQYITENPAGGKTIKIPLIDIFGMATHQEVNDDQIIQIVNLRILIGHDDSWVRSHKWDLYVFTNRDQVEVFQIDVDIQETEGCQPGQECIVIADLDTISNVYTDGTFAFVHNPPHKYNVGDIFYAKIKFADPTYTKRLIFIKLYLKTDTNKIFNFSSITTDNWDGDGLRISLPLVQPSQGAIIQVNMKISTVNARFLAGEEDQTVQSKFTVSISDNKTSISANQDTNGSNANILLGITVLATLFLLF